MDASQKLDNPILIFDRNGILGSLLVKRFTRSDTGQTSLSEKEQVCILVSGVFMKPSQKTIFIPLTKKIPVIPKCNYKAFFLVYDGDKTLLDLLPSFASKAKEDNAPVYFILNIREAEDKLIERVLAVSASISMLLLGDIFGGELSGQNPVTAILSQGATGKIILKNNGLSYVYPVSLESVLAVMRRLINLKGIKGHRILYLLPPHPVTELSFTRSLQRKEPLLKVDLLESKVFQKNAYTPGAYVSAFGSTYSFSGKLPPVEIEQGAKKSESGKSNRSGNHRRRKHPQLPVRNMLAAFIFSLILVTFGLPIFSAFAGAGLLSRMQTHLKNGELEKAKASANAAQQFFTFAGNSSIGITALGRLGFGGQTEVIMTGIRTGETIAEIGALGIDGASLLHKVFLAASLDPKRDFSNGIQNIKNVLVEASVLQAEGKIPSGLSTYLAQTDRLRHLVVSLSDVLPQLVGMDGAKKYLVIFQNNMELRPGGGFIGSYGLLHLDRGRIKDFPIYDVYDADGQLKDHYEPPFQLRRYLGSSHWFLRDSNFDIDFPKNGASAAFFYHTETGGDVDGVIAVDTTFIKNLLAVIGPLKVAGYNETVTAENFFLLTERYAQDNFFPGSRQKQDFLKAVAVSLLSRMTQSKNISYLKAATMLADSVSQKHVLFAFPDDSLQQVFNLNGMSSALEDSRAERNGQFNDFLGINEANLGMNKVNYYLDRSVSHLVAINPDGQAIEEVTVQYVNRSRQVDKYGGDYKTYVRFILPAGAEAASVQFNDAAQDTVQAVTDPAVFTAPGFLPSDGLEVEKTEEAGKTIIGFLVTVPMGEKKTVTLTYTVPTKASTANPALTYSLRLFKQPGTGADPYSFTFTGPGNYKILNATESVRITGSGASLLTTLAEDREIEIRMGKK